jgi:uncharacterized protein (TIGR02453 family)
MNSKVYQFLKELNENNNRTWFAEHKATYEAVRASANQFFWEVYEALSAVDVFSEPKMFRIYNDVRFSKDKLPYKPHFSAVISRKQPYNRGSMYIHYKPNASFIAGGFWNPEKDDLHSIRLAIAAEDDLQEILKEKSLLKFFGNIQGEALKTIPRGFEKEHPRAELLRMKQFIFTKQFKDAEFHDSSIIPTIVSHYESLQPFFQYMTTVLTTNANGEPIEFD